MNGDVAYARINTESGCNKAVIKRNKSHLDRILITQARQRVTERQKWRENEWSRSAGLLSYDHVELVGGSGGGSWSFKTFSFMRTHPKQNALLNVISQNLQWKASLFLLLTCQATYFIVKA